MAKTLIVAATVVEVEGLRSIFNGHDDYEILVTGVGMVNTTFSLTKMLASKELPSRIINVGIAGSFNQEIEIGQVVQVVKDSFSELGAEDNGSFLKGDFMGLVLKDELTFESESRFQDILQAIGITVNTIHGEEESIALAEQCFKPDVESMEGAAVAFVANQFGIQWIQIRSISNYVEPRNRDNWNIQLALENLTKTAAHLIQELK
jgi:futalosine hydrolase